MVLQDVDVSPKSLESYEVVSGWTVVDELRRLAEPLRGLRVAHVNATAYGGGVSELLHSVVPLYRALGLETDWLVMPGSQQFFAVTKELHNGLQGKAAKLATEQRRVYLDHSASVAAALEPRYDVVWIHDPQPAALRSLCGSRGARWIWRCHIDTSEPTDEFLDFLEPLLVDYDALVFTLEQFVPEALRGHRVAIIPPAIDPLSPKNLSLPTDICRQIVQWAGIRLDRPLLTQVSRFDPWKDPLGVIEAYRRIRTDVPGTQLALLGQMALDDPEGWSMYRSILDETRGDPDIEVLTNFTGIGNMEVNAFQSCSDVVLQKSIREGFGLVVAETLWKGTPVVAGRAGGIPLQMPEGVGGYLVDGVSECVERTVELLREPRLGRELAAAGRSRVRERFLVTRLVTDHLRLLGSLFAASRPSAVAAPAS